MTIQDAAVEILNELHVTDQLVRIPTYANQVYKVGDTLILKIYDSFEEWENTLRVYEMIRKQGLSSPEIKAKGTDPKPYILMTLLHGNPIEKEQNIETYRNFGRWVGQLHQITFDSFGGLSNEGVGKFYEINSGPFQTWKEMHLKLIQHRMKGFENTLLKPLITPIKEFFENYPYPQFQPCLIHEDLNVKNVFAKDGKISGVIDPDGGYAGCAEEELMRIEEGHFVNRPDLGEAFMEGYLEHHQLPEEYEDRRPLFRVSRKLVEAQCLINHANYKKDRKEEAFDAVYQIANSVLKGLEDDT